VHDVNDSCWNFDASLIANLAFTSIALVPFIAKPISTTVNGRRTTVIFESATGIHAQGVCIEYNIQFQCKLHLRLTELDESWMA
jgi:hypothetical protein